MRNYKDTPRQRGTNTQKALLVEGVVGIGKRRREGIIENSACLVEVDTMLCVVGDRLVRVPLENHVGSLQRNPSTSLPNS